MNVQAGLCLCFSQTLKTDFFASRPINLTKALNRLCECTGWYAPLLFANPEDGFFRVKAHKFNKNADQNVRMRRLFCAFVFRKPLKTCFRGQNLTKALIRLRGCAGWSAPFFVRKPPKTGFFASRPKFNKIAEYTGRMRRLVCAFVFRKPPNTGFLSRMRRLVCSLVFSSRGPNLTKALNRLCECTGWYEH